MASELTSIIREYKEIVKKLKVVEENFERYKIAFSRDFKDEIAKIEAQKIDKAKNASEAMVQPKPKPQPKMEVEVEVNVRKVDKKKQSNQKSMPAKVTQKKEPEKTKESSYQVPEELGSASAKPNDNIKVTKLYRKDEK